MYSLVLYDIYSTIVSYKTCDAVKMDQLCVKICFSAFTNFFFIALMIYRRKVLGVTDSWTDPGGLKWDVTLCNLLAWTIVFLVLSKGIKSLGKVKL